MKQRLIILGMWVLVLTTLSSFLAPLRASAAVPAGIDGTLVFADGEANAHEGAPGFALAWVEHAFNVSGVPVGAASAWTYYVALGKPNDGANPEGVPRGALVFFSGSGGDGHVGIALGDGQMISDLNIPGIKTGVYKGPLSEGGTLAGWAWPPADWPGRPELAGTSNVFVPTIPIPPLATAAVVATKLAAALPTAVKPAAALPRTTTTPRAATTTTTPRYATTTTPTTTSISPSLRIATTSTSLSASPPSSASAGTPVHLNAVITVIPSYGTADTGQFTDGNTRSWRRIVGTVQFKEGSTPIDTATVINGAASTDWTAPEPATGATVPSAGTPHSLSAVFTSASAYVLGSTSNTVTVRVTSSQATAKAALARTPAAPTTTPAPPPTTSTTPPPPASIQQQEAAQQQDLQQRVAQQQAAQQHSAQQQAAQQQALQQQAAQQHAAQQQAAQQHSAQQQAAQQRAAQQQALQQQTAQQQAAQQQA
ncbi:MAG: hypothetical protein QOG75_6445, partial [Mycobacterium sp.]|nr:hypothetical protein [Mycobacterium sp.]